MLREKKSFLLLSYCSITEVLYGSLPGCLPVNTQRDCGVKLGKRLGMGFSSSLSVNNEERVGKDAIYCDVRDGYELLKL